MERVLKFRCRAAFGHEVSIIELCVNACMAFLRFSVYSDIHGLFSGAT